MTVKDVIDKLMPFNLGASVIYMVINLYEADDYESIKRYKIGEKKLCVHGATGFYFIVGSRGQILLPQRLVRDTEDNVNLTHMYLLFGDRYDGEVVQSIIEDEMDELFTCKLKTLSDVTFPDDGVYVQPAQYYGSNSIISPFEINPF